MKYISLCAFILCFGFVKPAVAEHGAEHSWGYTGTGAAHNWGDLQRDFSVCKTGSEQSPVNIDRLQQTDLPPLQTNYQDNVLRVVNNGHTVQVNFDPGSTLSVGGQTYELLQFHFHTPSEHYINGASSPMEVHLVHKAQDGTLGVVGIMMNVGLHNPVVEGIWQNIPDAGMMKTIKTVMFSPSQILPEDLSYFKYEGSLTTPPCSEGVQWHVLKTPIELSQQQLAAFQRLFPVNARPIQPLGARSVQGQ